MHLYKGYQYNPSFFYERNINPYLSKNSNPYIDRRYMPVTERNRNAYSGFNDKYYSQRPSNRILNPLREFVKKIVETNGRRQGYISWKKRILDADRCLEDYDYYMQRNNLYNQRNYSYNQGQYPYSPYNNPYSQRNYSYRQNNYGMNRNYSRRGNDVLNPLKQFVKKIVEMNGRRQAYKTWKKKVEIEIPYNYYPQYNIPYYQRNYPQYPSMKKNYSSYPYTENNLNWNRNYYNQYERDKERRVLNPLKQFVKKIVEMNGRRQAYKTWKKKVQIEIPFSLYPGIYHPKSNREDYFSRNRQYEPYKPEEYPIFADYYKQSISAFKDNMKQKSDKQDLIAKNYLDYISNRQEERRSNSGGLSHTVGSTKNKDIYERVIQDKLNCSQNYGNPYENYHNRFNSQNNYAKSPLLTPVSTPRKSPSFYHSRLNELGTEITNPRYLYQDIYQSDLMNKKNYMNYNLVKSEDSYRNRRNPYSEEYNLQINPFNLRQTEDLGKSTLAHNPILNPVPNYQYNRYLNRKYKEQY
ncbi:MAG: hypothetical protein MJ252_15045 [archaeon]|nr:hypothetical protein [archaeon]